MEKDKMRSRSFRYEDYNNRRAFLRSYPLFNGDEEEEKEEELDETKKKTEANANAAATKEINSKKHMKKILLAVIEWGEERAIIIKRLKHKVTLYVITCLPVGLKAPTALISA